MMLTFLKHEEEGKRVNNPTDGFMARSGHSLHYFLRYSLVLSYMADTQAQEKPEDGVLLGTQEKKTVSVNIRPVPVMSLKHEEKYIKLGIRHDVVREKAMKEQERNKDSKSNRCELIFIIPLMR